MRSLACSPTFIASHLPLGSFVRLLAPAQSRSYSIQQLNCASFVFSLSLAVYSKTLSSLKLFECDDRSIYLFNPFIMQMRNTWKLPFTETVCIDSWLQAFSVCVLLFFAFSKDTLWFSPRSNTIWLFSCWRPLFFCSSSLVRTKQASERGGGKQLHLPTDFVSFKFTYYDNEQRAE